MREIIYVERSTKIKDGRSVFAERKCYGQIEQDGHFRLLSCCGKWFPTQSSSTKKQAAGKTSKKAA